MKRCHPIGISFMLLCVCMCTQVYGLQITKSADSKKFENVYEHTAIKESVREITYEQFLEIRKSGEKYVLLDVRSKESYKNGHIADASSLPLNTLNKVTIEKLFSKDSRIIVYCASVSCHASTQAATELTGMGYKVLDYKGGIKEWKDKGNSLKKE